MKKFKIRFSVKGKAYETIVDAQSDSKARELIKLQYGKEVSFLGSREVN